MEKQSKVVFRNVGQLYFPQSRVECHYNLTSEHHWTNTDWIGLFKVGWSSVKDYLTFCWALAPEGYIKGTNVDCCVHFQAFFLPRPSEVEYQFVYIDEKGNVCGCSRQFTFCAPKPLDELETLEEDRDGEEEGDGEMENLLLVVPRAQILQSRLEDCLRERDNLLQALELSERTKDVEIEKSEEAKKEWEKEKEEMQAEISELRENLTNCWDKIEKIEGTNKDVQCSQESLSTELTGLLAGKAESQQRIKELEDDIMALTDREKETEAELERMKQRVKKMSTQRKEEELEKRNLLLESHEALEELRGLQERLEASERGGEALRRDLCELGAQQGHTHAELHQVRLQAAQLTLQLSDSNLALREGRANWAQEREAFKQAAEADKERIQKMSREAQRKEEWLQEERMEREKLEVELGREKDCNRVQLSDARREVQELKASLRMKQKEEDRQTMERQDLQDYIRQLEQRLESVADDKWTEAARFSTTPDSLSEEDKEDSAPAEALVESSYTERVESPTQPDSLHQSQPDDITRDTCMDKEEMESHLSQSSGEEKPLVLSDLTDPILSELADSPLW